MGSGVVALVWPHHVHPAERKWFERTSSQVIWTNIVGPPRQRDSSDIGAPGLPGLLRYRRSQSRWRHRDTCDVIGTRRARTRAAPGLAAPGLPGLLRYRRSQSRWHHRDTCDVIGTGISDVGIPSPAPGLAAPGLAAPGHSDIGNLSPDYVIGTLMTSSGLALRGPELSCCLRPCPDSHSGVLVELFAWPALVPIDWKATVSGSPDSRQGLSRKAKRTSVWRFRGVEKGGDGPRNVGVGR